MINVYGLCYRIVEYAEKTINRLKETASEKFNLICVEAKSCKSNEFLKWGTNCLYQDKIQKFVTSSTNCRGDGLRWIIENIPPDESEDFFVMTDLDLLIPEKVDWIAEIRNKMKSNVISGFTLSSENYVPPNFGWYEEHILKNKLFGNWLMAIKTKPFFEFLNDLKQQDKKLEDRFIISGMKKFGKRDLIDKKLYHLGWDVWKDDPDYWKHKHRSFSNSWQTNRDEDDLDLEPRYKIYQKEFMQTKKSLELVESITKKIPSFHHHYHILYDIASSIKKEKINYVEIGAYCGASATLMLHHKNVNVTSIDIGDPISKETAVQNVKKYFDDNRFLYILGNSHDKKTKETLMNHVQEIDILFIDGDHSLNGTIQDFEDYHPLVCKNGYVVMDDYLCPVSKEVKPAVDKIVSKLSKEDFKIIGIMPNLFKAKPSNFKQNNCFVLQKL